MPDLSLVFVYGTLRRGQVNHRLLAEAELIGPATSCEDWLMVDCWGGAFPAVIGCGVEVVGHADACPIVGEVYRVDPETMRRLDRLEGYPLHYDRGVFEFDVLGERVEAWMYFQERVDDRPTIAGGDWCKRTTRREVV